MDTSTLPAVKESPELNKEASEIITTAEGYAVIFDDAHQAEAVEFQKRIKAAIKKADEFFDGDIKRAHELHKSLCASKKKVTGDLEKAERILSPAIANYQLQKIAALEAEQKKAAKQAEKKGLPPPAARAPDKLDGLSVAVTWSAEVTDLMALVKAVAAKKAPIEALQANPAFLNGEARKLKDNFNYPGCKAVSSAGTRSRG